MVCEAYNCNCDKVTPELDRYNGIIDQIANLEFSTRFISARGAINYTYGKYL